MFKLLVLIAFLVYVTPSPAVSPEFLQATRPVRDICLQKSGSSDAAIENFVSSPGAIPVDAKLKTYMSCIVKELKLVDASGNVMLQELFQMLPPDISADFQAMSKDCMKLQGKTLEDKLWWLHSCWKKADPVKYFMV